MIAKDTKKSSPQSADRNEDEETCTDEQCFAGKVAQKLFHDVLLSERTRFCPDLLMTDAGGFTSITELFLLP